MVRCGEMRCTGLLGPRHQGVDEGARVGFTGDGSHTADVFGQSEVRKLQQRYIAAFGCPQRDDLLAQASAFVEQIVEPRDALACIGCVRSSRQRVAEQRLLP